MPGTNLTRDEAQRRAALLNVDSYAVELDLTVSETLFRSTTTIAFTSRETGAATFADLIAPTVHSIRLNGRDLDPDQAYRDSRIELEDLAEENVLEVVADCAFSHTGEGLHRFVDPVDQRVYTYTQFEVPDARRVYTTFEQPDLKSVFTFEVKAPEGWVVVSNSPTPAPEPTEGGNWWRFAPTKPMSTYITAVVAGEYHAEFDTYVGAYGEIPLGHYCRQSLVEHLDTEELVKLTKQSFAFFEEQFATPYPFGKYDQLYVPEYNMGAMENAGCVTLRDEYLPRSRQPRSFFEFRASVITHEMAHMWFGNLVTMKWWDDLWLNESFAEWACYWCEAEATEFTDAWTGFANSRKQTGYEADELPSTHPVAADNYDLEAVEVNFDMITYAKGASVLKQLVAWVGLEPFLAGLRQYFADFAYGNPEFSDLLAALEKSSGRELQGWAREWLQTAGVNTLTPEIIECGGCDDGTMESVYVLQSAPADHPTLRRHRLGIGLYDEVDGRLQRRRYVEVDVEGEVTEVDELVGEMRPALLLLNDADHAYARIRLDDRSLATAIEGLSTVEDSLARALVWSAAWDMVRSAELPARDYVTLVLSNIGSETDPSAISRIPRLAASAISLYADPAHRDRLRGEWERGIGALMRAAAPGSDHQLTFLRSYAAAATGEEALEEVRGLLEGTRTLDGLRVDQDLRWSLVTALARAGVYGEDEIAAEQASDQTISGKEKAAAARAARPDAEAKRAAWAALLDPATPNETSRSIAFSIFRPGQEEYVAPYLEEYLAAADHLISTIGFHKASVILEYGFPTVLATQETVDRVDAWLASTDAPKGAVRFVTEGRADVVRAVAAQARDAQAGADTAPTD